MKALIMMLGLLLVQQLVTLQARILQEPESSWPGEQAARALSKALPALLKAADIQPASAAAVPYELAMAFVQHEAAFKFNGPAGTAPTAYLAVAHDIQLQVTRVLLDKALVILAKLGKLDLVADILFTYIATPDPVTGGKSECSVRLTTELQPVMKLLMKYNYTEAVKRLLVKIIDAPRGPDVYLGTCAPDLTAVLLAVAGMNCRESGVMVAPTNVVIDRTKPSPSGVSFDLKNVSCVYSPEQGEYEDMAGALLGGALMSELLLNKEASLVKDGRALAFAMVRMAFTVLQSNNFSDCMVNFLKYERKIPKTSYPLVSPVVPPDYYIGPLLLNSTAGSSAALCYATALLSFDADKAAAEQPWKPSAMAQVLVNVWLAMGREMKDSTTSGLTQAQLDSLCDSLHHILRFRGNPARTTPVDMYLADQYQCVFNPSIKPCPPEGVAPLSGIRWFKRFPALAEGHDLSSPLYYCQGKV